MPNTSDAEYDLFISYAHADNGDGWLTALIEAVKAEHAKFTSTPLRIFFDEQEIQSMSDWEHRIMRGIRESKIMLAALSPAYFQSEYCRKEWELYVEHELSQAMPGEAIAPIYIATHEEFEEHASEALNEWMRNLKRRQYVDVRPWWEDGPHAMERDDVRQRLELMDQQIGERLERLTRAKASPTSVPDHNPNFVGRIDELRRLREILALGRVGAIATLHGFGGVGKSAIAFEYAHAFAEHYPDGRFLISCEGDSDLRMSLLKLVPQLGIELNSTEQRSLDAAAARVKALLAERTRTLLILDNVDDPQLLAAKACAQYLPDGAKVHVLATTRMAPDRLPGTECLALDALSEEDAIRLLEKHRPFSSTRRDEDWKAALRIVRRLGGHALAIEVVAVFLWQNPDVSYEGYLERLKSDGLEAVEGIAEDDEVQLSRHTTKLISELIEPTLAGLSSEEKSVLEAASLLPPDNIALPWVRHLISPEFPELSQDPRPGYPDPWRKITRRLFGLRLVTPNDGGMTCRMHRLVRDVVARRMGKRRKIRSKRTQKHARVRAKALWEEWIQKDARWELSPLVDYAYLLMNSGHSFGGWVANQLSGPLIQLGRFAETRDLLQQAVALQERLDEPEDSKLANSYSNLAMLRREMGELEEARELLNRAITVWEQLGDPPSRKLPYGYSNLSTVQRALGNYESARDLAARAVELWEQADEPNQKALAAGYANLAHVEVYLSNLDSACELHAKAMACIEEVHGPDHPMLATSCSDLATVQRKLGNYAEARELCERAVSIKEKIHEPDHPSLADSYASLAAVENDLAKFSSVRELWQRVISIREKVYEPDSRILAYSYLGLASVEKNLAHYSSAGELLERSLRIQESVYGPDHPSVGDTLASLASLDHDLAHYDSARDRYQRSLAIAENAFDDEDHPMLANRYSGMATLQKTMAKYATARVLLDRVIEIRTAAYRPDHPSLASSYAAMASLEQDLANYDVARGLHEQAMAIRQQAFDADHPTLASAYSGLASLEREFRNMRRALELTQQALAIREKVFEPDHPALAGSYSAMARFEWERGNKSESERLHRLTLTIREKVFEPDHPVMANSFSSLGSLERSLGRLDEARDLYQRALAIREKLFPKDHPLIASSYVGLASVERDSGNSEKARELLSESIEIDRKVFGDEHPSVARDCSALAYLEADQGRANEAVDLMQRAWAIRKLKYREGDDRTRVCERWLRKHDPAFEDV